MRLFGFSIALCLAPVAALAVAIREAPFRMAALAFDFLAAAFALFRPEPFAIAGDYAGYSGGGSPLDSSLQHSLRHEAQTRRRGAHRHI